MNPLGNAAYWIGALLVAGIIAMLASFGGGYGYPWLGIAGALVVVGFVIVVLASLGSARYS
jgi:hypothetical protein